MKKVLILFCSFLAFKAQSQGCSDAGFCSLSPVSPLSNNFSTNSKANTLRLGFGYGKAENSINAYNPFLEYTRRVNSNISFNTRINFLAHTGNDVQTGEIGDIFFTGKFRIAPKFTTTLGFKVPLRNGDKVKRGIILPMDYQPTLGTLDFLWAIQTNICKWQISAGWQQPLTQNSNQFFTTNFVATEEFQTTNSFRRNPDIWLRVAYPFTCGNWSIIPNLLPIYHLGNDSYKDEFGVRKSILGSRGLTLNADVQLDYKLCENSILGLNVAAPIVTRDAQPDGLARKYVLTLDYRKSF